MRHRFNNQIATLQSRHFRDAGDYRQTVLLAGTGRSGTTWVGNMINHRNDFRVMFEPFHSFNVDSLTHWHYKQYLRPDNAETAFLDPARAILSGRIRHPWIDRYNRKFFARKRLIKDIRANLFLKWIHHHFPEIPVILLIRHPCAVAHSRVQLGWNCHLDSFLAQPELMGDFLEPFRDELENAADNFEKHVFMWCVETAIPLRQFSPGEMLIVFYEHLCMEPHAEIERIGRFLGDRFDGETARETVSRPSALARKESAVRTGANMIESWRNQVDDVQRARAGEICRLFGLDAIYGEESVPSMTGEGALRMFMKASPALAG